VHVAARTGNIQIVHLLKQHGARVGSSNALGQTPLHIAAQHGQLDVCALLAHASNVLKMDADALTPLHHGVRNGKEEVVDFLATYLRHWSKVI
jgi:ankyrin repeat protein